MHCKYCGHTLKVSDGTLVSVRTGIGSCLGKPGVHIPFPTSTVARIEPKPSLFWGDEETERNGRIY